MIRRKKEVLERYMGKVRNEMTVELQAGLAQWAQDNQEKVAKYYNELTPLATISDRHAELLLPLQATMKAAVADGLDDLDDHSKGMAMIQQFAERRAKEEREQQNSSDGVLLLADCREIFKSMGKEFLPTTTLIERLVELEERPWGEYSKGHAITDMALANLLKRYGIKSARSKDQSCRGYYAHDFKEAWSQFLNGNGNGHSNGNGNGHTTSEKPSKPSSPSIDESDKLF
jgi:Protein of unknown function (DUF3631)